MHYGLAVRGAHDRDDVETIAIDAGVRSDRNLTAAPKDAEDRALCSDGSTGVRMGMFQRLALVPSERGLDDRLQIR